MDPSPPPRRPVSEDWFAAFVHAFTLLAMLLQLGILAGAAFVP